MVKIQKCFESDQKSPSQVTMSERNQKYFRRIKIFNEKEAHFQLERLVNQGKRTQIMMNYYEEFEESAKILPLFYIIDFYNYFHQHYSRKLERDQSLKSIDSLLNKDNTLKQKYKLFCENWNKFYSKRELQFGDDCHTLEKKTFDEKDIIENLFVRKGTDNQYKGLYLLALIEEIAKTQNNLLSKIQQAIASNGLEYKIPTFDSEINPFSLNLTQLIHFDQKNELGLLMKSFCLNDVNVGQENNLYFNIEKIEEKIIGQLYFKSLISPNVLNYVKIFKFLEEIVTSGYDQYIIIMIQDQIKHQPIPEFILKQMNLEKMTPEDLDQAHKLLTYLLNFLLKVEFPQQPLNEFIINKLKDEQLPFKTTFKEFESLKVSQSIALYEIIEEMVVDTKKFRSLPEFLCKKWNGNLYFQNEGQKKVLKSAMAKMIIRLGDEIN